MRSSDRFEDLSQLVIEWSKARQIIPNSTAVAQYRKACEEMDELGQALDWSDRSGVIDGVGDVVVCLINLCALSGLDLADCLAHAYEEIKDRTGTMNEQGIFVKDK